MAGIRPHHPRTVRRFEAVRHSRSLLTSSSDWDGEFPLMAGDSAHPAAASSENAIEVRGLTKQYGDLLAVRGIDLDVRRGECFALLGPNGAGKTTTVEIMEGFRPRTAGSVSVLGVDPEHASRDWRARVGIVLQGIGEFEALTVGEVVSHFTSYYPNPRDPWATIE